MLDGQGYPNYPVTNVIHANEILRDEHPQIVVIAMGSKDEKSVEFIDLIKRQLIATDFVYVIALTPQSDVRSIVGAFEAGVNDVVCKPIIKQELIARINSATKIIELQQNLTEKCVQLISVNSKLRKLSDQHKMLSRTDSLTGLGNRMAAMSQLEEIWHLTTRHNGDMSCLYIDVDHFKAINDQFGHDAGDAALCHVAKTLMDNSRKEELVFRIGGEEFLVLCPFTGITGAIEAGNRMCLAVRNSPVHVKTSLHIPDFRTIHITVSVGVASKGDGVESTDKLLSVADKRLYGAKQNGRNKVFYDKAKFSQNF